MKIGIDARLFGTKHGGIGRYTEQLIKNLEKLDQSNQYYIFLQNSEFADYQPQNSNFIKVKANFRPYSISEQLLFPFLLYRYQLDLIHFTHFNVPIFYCKRFFVTIHDLIITHYPGSRATTLSPIIYQLKLWSYNFIIKIVAKKAKKIITVSNYTKDDIIKFLKVSPKKIEVFYEGVELPIINNSTDNELLKKFELKEDFLLYVGSAYPHKNLEKLILAFLALAEKKPNLKLVLVGKNNFFYQKLRDWIISLNNENGSRIVFTDYLTDEQLVNLYLSAKIYVFPSLIEGFGLPPLEAQSYDLPVLTSNASCLPEILGNGAYYFNPNSIEDIKEKIELLLDDEGLRKSLIEKGKNNLKKYSWQKMTENILNLYNTK